MKFSALLVLPLAAAFAFAGEPVLVGHWKLDEKEGDTAADSSSAKNNAKAINAPGRSAGKIGGAFTFDGKNQYIEIPNSKELESVQENSYTLAAWFKAENVPPGTEDANDAQYGIVMKTGWHEGLCYEGNKKFSFVHWNKGDPDPMWTGIGTWETEYEAGEWRHVVGVMDKEARVTKIYVDGELIKTSEAWDEKAVSRPYGQTTWKIGVGAPGSEKYAWHAKGAIDDVRIYNGALKDEQIKALYEVGKAGKE